MSSDHPGSGGWANPGQPPSDPGTPPPPPGWGSAPPPPRPPGWNQLPPGWIPAHTTAAPRPGVVPLRPLGVGELLDGAFTTIRRYPAATLGLSAAVMLVVEVVQLIASYYLLHGLTRTTSTSPFGTATNGHYLARLYTVNGITAVLTLIASALLTGMLTTVAGQAVLGRTMSAGDAWRATRPLLLRLIGAIFLIALCWVLAGIVAAIPGILLTVVGVAASSTALIALGLILAVFGWIAGAALVYVRLVLAPPALVLEKLGVGASLSRSWGLVQSSWWRTFGIAVLAYLIALVVGGIIQAPFVIAGGIGNFFSNSSTDQVTFTALLLTGIGGLLSATLVRPFQAGSIALLYIDRRMRAEALDLTLQQAATVSTP